MSAIMLIFSLKIRANTMTFMDICNKYTCQTKYIFIRDIWFLFLFLTVYTFFRLTGTFLVVFILANHFFCCCCCCCCCCFVFDHRDVTFKSFSKGASASFSFISSPFSHLWCFLALELFKVSFLKHYPYWWPTDSCLFGNFCRC